MASEMIVHLLNEFWTLTDKIFATNVTSSKKQTCSLTCGGMKGVSSEEKATEGKGNCHPSRCSCLHVRMLHLSSVYRTPAASFTLRLPPRATRVYSQKITAALSLPLSLSLSLSLLPSLPLFIFLNQSLCFG